MATSPIYSWPEPDNTDLVKNGALAIRTLGDAIDTTMGTMVAKTIIDAKGDLIAGSAADTASRLAVGANGETLVADSSTATGLRYTAGTVQANPFINSAFQVWQRGTSASFGGAGVVTAADRWATYTAGSATTLSRQVTGDTTNLPFIQYCGRMQRNSGSSDTGLLEMGQSIETINAIPFAGKTVTLSFYARAGANYSATSNVFASFMRTGTGTDQNYVATSYTGLATPFSQNNTLTTTWQRFTQTGTIASTATEIAVDFRWTPTGTAGANDYADVTGVQLDIGSVALPFRTNGGTIQGELAAAMRYYQNRWTGTGKWYTTTTAQCYEVLPVPMRVAPTLGTTVSGNVGEIGVSDRAISAIHTSDLSAVGGYIAFTTATATNNAVAGCFNVSVQLSAEL